MKKTNLVALGLSVALMSAAALAQNTATTADVHHGHGDHFKKADTNGDGFISKDEFLARSGQRFDKLDGDKDGKVSQDEMKAAHEKFAAKRAEWKAKHASGNSAK
jgi:hypothetical protein